MQDRKRAAQLLKLLGPEVVIQQKFDRQIVVCDLIALHSHRASVSYFWQLLNLIINPQAPSDLPILLPVDSGYRPGSPNQLSRQEALQQAADHIIERIKQLPASVDIILTSSGSTKPGGHIVGLSAQALQHSARATRQRIGGPGRWFAVLPTDHIAGFQVLARSLAQGYRPVVCFDQGSFTGLELAHQLRQWRQLDGKHLPFFTSLVPLQLRRCLQDTDVTKALCQCKAILVGGSAIPQSLLDEGRRRGLNLVTTYGMTETCGGCIYDGRPLPGTKIRLEDDGRVLISTPSIMSGYLEDELPVGPASGLSWLKTNDLGRLVPLSSRSQTAQPPQILDEQSHYRLEVIGRADEVIISGGHNVALPAVLVALDHKPQLRALYQEAIALGKADEEWGQVVTLVLSSSVSASELGPKLRKELRSVLPAHALPRIVITLDQLPHLPNGKINRLKTKALAEDMHRQGPSNRVWYYEKQRPAYADIQAQEN